MPTTARSVRPTHANNRHLLTRIPKAPERAPLSSIVGPAAGGAEAQGRRYLIHDQRRFVNPESRNPSDDAVNITPSSNKTTPKQVCSKTKSGLALCAFVGATLLLSLLYPYWCPANNFFALGRSYQNQTKEVEEQPNSAKITSENKIAFLPGCTWE